MNDFTIEEFERLKELLRTGKMERNKSNNFVDEDCFDDDTSKSEIYKQQFLFMKEASKFLDENFKDEFIVSMDFCVHVIDRKWYFSR